MGTRAIKQPPEEPSGYPYRTPRWVLWTISVASLLTVGIAFVVGPGDSQGAQRAARARPRPPAGTSNPNIASSTNTTTSTSRPLTVPLEAPTTAELPPPPEHPSTTSRVPTSTAPPVTPPTSAPPATAPAPTVPPTAVPPTPVPPPRGAVVVASCRITGTDLTANGTVTNNGATSQGYRAHTVVVDAGGAMVADVKTDVASVAPGRSTSWVVTQTMGSSGIRAAACRAGPAEPV